MRKIIVFFNSYDFGSTGTLCKQLISACKDNDYETFFIVGSETNNKDYYSIMNSNSLFDRRLTKLYRITLGNKDGLNAVKETNRLIKYLDSNIDFKNTKVIFNFHNVQFMSINIFKIINFSKKNNVEIVWTLHDCWPLTGGCNYFTLINCESWSNNVECRRCKKKCPNSHSVFINKSKSINNYYNHITFVSPSSWLDSIVSKSYIKSNHFVINNGIDTGFWTLADKKQTKTTNLLSLASPWDERKGLVFLNQLADLLPENYVLHVGGLCDENITNPKIKRYGFLNKNELKALYDASDIFINPTLEENFPTVNIEALLCGLPVVSFNTGGSCEIFDEETGISINDKNADGLLRGILSIKFSNGLRKKCHERGSVFNTETFCKKYINLFDEIVRNNND